MRRNVADCLKVGLLLAALMIVGWSVGPGAAQADVICEGSAHTCHIIPAGGGLLHKEEMPSY